MITPPTSLTTLLQGYVDRGEVPGALGLVAHGTEVEVAVVGSVDVEGSAPMARDTLIRIASLTKPITAMTLSMLIDDQPVALDDPIARWLPELVSPVVVRTPDGPVDDVVPAARAITVRDVLSGRTGYGFASDFDLPAVQLIFDVQSDGRYPQRRAAPDAWLRQLAAVPLLYQPGERWLYDTSSDLQGVLISRITGRSLSEVMAERVFGPLGMIDTGFTVPPDQLSRLGSAYRHDDGGRLVLADPPDGQWSHPAAFASGAGGLVPTLDDWYAFARFLLAGGTVDGRALLSPSGIAGLMSNHLDTDQRSAGDLFLDGQGWGYGGSVDIDPIEVWNVPGRYGWVGGTGTAGHVVPATGDVTILLTQVYMGGPVQLKIMTDVWRYAARRG